jgi:membrane protein YdbS with pleckstrin-like domain
MRLDIDPSDSAARRAKAWAASAVLTLAAVAVFVVAWFVSITYLSPLIGSGAVVLVLIFGGALAYGVGRVSRWLARG